MKIDKETHISDKIEGLNLANTNSASYAHDTVYICKDGYFFYDRERNAYTEVIQKKLLWRFLISIKYLFRFYLQYKRLIKEVESWLKNDGV